MMKKILLTLGLTAVSWLSFAQSYTGGACPTNQAIPDNDPVGISVPITVTGAVGTSLGTDVILEEVRVHITHSWSSDIDMFIESPNAAVAEIATVVGGSGRQFGDDCNNVTVFRMDAATTITSGAGNFVGTFLPEGDFATFNDGSDPNGTWNFLVADNAGGDVGEVEYIELIFAAPPTCPQPDSLYATTITPTSLDLGWVERGSATQWQIEYGASGFTPGTGTFVTSTSIPENIGGLTGYTDYDFYVRSVCGVGDSSAWFGPLTVTTACGTFSTPYLDDVEAHASSTSFSASDCWTNVSGTYDWNIDAGGSTPSTGTGPTDAYSGSQYFYTEASSGSAGDSAILYTPMIDLSSLTVPQLRFYYHMFGDNRGIMGDLYIQIWDGASWDMLDSLINEQHVSLNDPWKDLQIDLSSYSGVVQIRFIAIKDGAQYGDICLDDIEIRETPSCPEPTSFMVDSVSEVSTTLSWVEFGSATTWEIEYGTAGFTPGTGNSVITSSNPHTFSGLTPGTSYEFYLRAVCGAGDSSIWVGPIIGNTLLPLPVPVSCITGNPGFAFTDDMDAQGGWTGDIGTTDGLWQFNTGGTGSSNTGPSAAHSGSSYIYAEASGSGQPYDISIVSPAIDLTAGSDDAELSFWLHAYGADIGTLTVGVSNSATGPFTPLLTNNNIQRQSDELDPWINVGVDLAAYVGQTIYIEFNYVSGASFAGDLALDLIEVQTCLSCLVPLNVTGTALSDDSIQVGWNPNGTATQWAIEYGLSGFTPGTGTTIVTTDTSNVVGGLMANTDYDFYVTSICGVGDSSSRVGPVVATTDCGTYSTPYLDDLEAHAATTSFTTSECWTNVSGAYDWNIDAGGSTPSTGTGPTDAYSGSQYFYTEASSGSAGDSAILYTPMIDLSALTSPLLSFYYHMFGDNRGIMGNLYIQIWDGTSWNMLDSLINEQQVSQADPWKLMRANLSAYSGVVQLRFIAIKDGAQYGDICLDDIEIAESPSCPEPSSLAVDSATEVSVTLSWVEFGSATTWEIEYDTAGFTPGTGMTMTTTTNPTTITGLSGATEYQFYVRSVCAPGDSSVWTSAINFTTPCGAFTATYTESFDGFTLTGTADQLTNQIDCWRATGPGANDVDLVSSTDDSEPIPSGPNCIELNDGNLGSGDSALLVSPAFSDLPSGLNQIRFKAHQESGGTDGLYIGVMTDPDDAATFTLIQKIEADTLLAISGFQEYTIPLTNVALIGSAQHIAFLHGADIYETYIDDFIYEPGCEETTGIAVTAADTSAQISWTSAGAVEVLYGDSTTPISGGTSVTGTTSPLIITGLNPETTYWFVVRTDCGGGQFGPWSDSTAFTTTFTDGLLAGFGNKLKYYPNPAKDRVFVEVSEIGGPLNVSVITNTGQQVASETIIGSGTKSIDIADLPAGIYNLRFSSGDVIEHRKLVIQ